MKLLDKTNIHIMEFLFLVCFVLYAGRGSVFARELGNTTELGNLTACLIAGIFLFCNSTKINLTKSYAVLLCVIFIYITLTFLVYDYLATGNYLKWLILFTIGFIISDFYNKRLFVVYETIIFWFSIISLIFWAVQIISPSALLDFMRSIRFSSSYGEKFDIVNVLVYTMYDKVYSGDYYIIARNAGFAWEPGAFSCHICLAMFCNSLRTNLSLRNNIPLYVFAITLFSTQSTTGIATMMVMYAVWLTINKKYAYSIILYIFASYALGLSFVGEKIFTQAQTANQYDYNEESGMGRFPSFLICWNDFLENPILGDYGSSELSFSRRLGVENSLNSGFGLLLKKYGGIMTVLFIVMLIKSARYLNIWFQTKNGYLMVVALSGMLISYSFWDQPIMIAFWAFFLISDNYK